MLFKEIVFLLGLLPLSALGQFPNNPCHIEGQVCETTDDNLIEIISDVDTLEECRDLCHTSAKYHVFNYFGNNSFPFVKTCMTLSACDNPLQCEDCYAENKYCPCGSTVEGQIGDNLIEYIPSVPSGSDCKHMCADNEGCKFFTYYDENHTGFPNICFLLSDLEDPIQSCENCISSPVDCNVGHCGFLGTQNISAMIISESTKVTVFKLGKCNLKALAMGPGGYYGSYFNGNCIYRNGGGSGYLNFTLIPVNSHFELTINVGKYHGDSSSIVAEDGTVLLKAASGEDGQDRGKAGDGYSGGGGAGEVCSGNYNPGGDGGCNGSSGQKTSHGDPGIGSGFQVDKLPFQVLSIR